MSDQAQNWHYLYQIECHTPYHVYIGITTSPAHRKWQHEHARGAEFTKKHGVKKFTVLQRFHNFEAARIAEDLRTRQLDARELLTVRGGSWTSSVESCSIRDLSFQKPFYNPRIARRRRRRTTYPTNTYGRSRHFSAGG